MFFDVRRYDLSKFGRYKYHKKLALADRITGKQLASPAVAPRTGEILADAGEVLTREKAEAIQAAGVDTVYLTVEENTVKVFSNGMVDIKNFKMCIRDRSTAEGGGAR